MVQGIGYIGELDEIAEVLDSRIPAAFVDTPHERRAISRREHGVVAADDHTARRVACVLSEFTRRRALNERTAHTARKTHALTLYVGPGGLPDCNCLGVVAKIDADLLENRIGIVLHQCETFLAQDFVIGNLAGNEGNRCPGSGGARSPLRVAAAGTPRVTGLRDLIWHGCSPDLPAVCPPDACNTSARIESLRPHAPGNRAQDHMPARSRQSDFPGSSGCRPRWWPTTRQSALGGRSLRLPPHHDAPATWSSTESASGLSAAREKKWRGRPARGSKSSGSETSV